ncbi:exosortase/archaeosortase family protein [Edaphobacter flagellatus]|uniref:exosortase/archaeosortase family protein n=1 Tax=Edaphobacter flagellatus TaxID=1933044 RepID=UPI0021B25CEC|nr:exosortase/archaeosortase family protein [Edaphobacter flagellatus]
MDRNSSHMMAGSTQTAPAISETEMRSGGPTAVSQLRVPRGFWLPFLIILGLLVALYFRVGIKLVVDWYNIADYSHGFLVPLFSLFLLWDKRHKIAATPIQPSWAGLPLVVFGLITLVFGIYGVDLFTSRVSFVILTIGLVWIFFGKAILREVLFPILVLLLAIPFPAIIFNQITFPLQLLASRLASAVLPLMGVPVLQEGNVIQLPVMKLEVAEACSGIRSLMSLFTLAVFYGYFLEKSTSRRIILALASIPIAVAANVARIVGTGLCVQYWDPNKALGFFHEFSGWVMFVVSLCCLYLVHRVMSLIAPATKEAA